MDPDFRRTVPAPDFLAAASISPGERVFKPARALYFPTTGLLALVRTLNPDEPPLTCFVSGHGFSRAVKSHSNEGFSPSDLAFPPGANSGRPIIPTRDALYLPTLDSAMLRKTFVMLPAPSFER